MAYPDFLIFELVGIAAFILTSYHSSVRKGVWPTLVFLLPAALWGFIIEFMTQEVFMRYHYGSEFMLYLLNVPLCIALYWAVLIYWGYKLAKGRLRLKNRAQVGLVTAIPLLAIDFLILEPLAKTFGYWVWTPETIWFGAPIGNFVGWFTVIFLYAVSYDFSVSRFKEPKKQLALNLALIIPSLTLLLVILKLWGMSIGL